MNVFIIGGTSGIGLALASFYQQKGHRVGVCGRDLSKLPKAVPFESYKADVIDKALLTQVIRQFVGSDTLSLLINCAGSYAEDVVGEISWQNVYYYFNKWSKDGSFQRVWLNLLSKKKSRNHK